jgi:hypothetical protein
LESDASTNGRQGLGLAMNLVVFAMASTQTTSRSREAVDWLGSYRRRGHAFRGDAPRAEHQVPLWMEPMGPRLGVSSQQGGDNGGGGARQKPRLRTQLLVAFSAPLMAAEEHAALLGTRLARACPGVPWCWRVAPGPGSPASSPSFSSSRSPTCLRGRLARPVLAAPHPYIRDHAGPIHLCLCCLPPPRRRARRQPAAKATSTRCSLAFNFEPPRASPSPPT